MNFANVFYKYSANSHDFVLNKVFEGFGRGAELSMIPGPREKIFQTSYEIILAYLLMDVAIMKENSTLSFSNKPRVTFL